MSELLFGLIFAHFVADFLLQTDDINSLKSKIRKRKGICALLKHSFHHFLCYFIICSVHCLLFNANPIYILLTPFLISITHFIIDCLKAFICHRTSVFLNTITYIIDQLLHIITIFLILQFVTKQIHYSTFEIINFFKYFLNKENVYILLSLKDKLFLLGTIIIITTHVSGYLIGMILKPFELKHSFHHSKIETRYSNNTLEHITEITDTTKFYRDSASKVGQYIGMIERLIIVILVSFEAINSVGFLIALKALTRFRQFEDKQFAEYYLVGSLLSILLGLVIGFFTMKILTIA